MNIKINKIIDIQNFIHEASKVEGDVFLTRNGIRVNGKSLMGVLSIDPSIECEIEYPQSNINFTKYIMNFTK